MDEAADYDVSKYLETTQPWNKDPTLFLERYYSVFYKPEAGIYVRQAPSKVCVIGLIKTHVGSVKLHLDLVGQKVKHDSVLCDLIGPDGQQVGQVKACMEGKLLELNTRYPKETDYLMSENRHLDIGFIGIILPKTEETSIQLKGFISEVDYKNT